MDTLTVFGALTMVVVVVSFLEISFAAIWMIWIRLNLWKITEALKAIAESKRLSTILTIEGKKDLDITPGDFEAHHNPQVIGTPPLA